MNRRRFFGGIAALCASPVVAAKVAVPSIVMTVGAGASTQSARQAAQGVTRVWANGRLIHPEPEWLGASLYVDRDGVFSLDPPPA